MDLNKHCHPSEFQSAIRDGRVRKKRRSDSENAGGSSVNKTNRTPVETSHLEPVGPTVGAKGVAERPRGKAACGVTTPRLRNATLRGSSQRSVAMFYEVATRCQLCLVILDFTGRCRRRINSLTDKMLIAQRDNRVGVLL